MKTPAQSVGVLSPWPPQLCSPLVQLEVLEQTRVNENSPTPLQAVPCLVVELHLPRDPYSHRPLKSCTHELALLVLFWHKLCFQVSDPSDEDIGSFRNICLAAVLGLCVGHSLQEEALYSLKRCLCQELAKRELAGRSQRCRKRFCSELLIDSFLLNDSILPQSEKGDVSFLPKENWGLWVFFFLWLLFLWLTF